jgi:hypothetical protein
MLLKLLKNWGDGWKGSIVAVDEKTGAMLLRKKIAAVAPEGAASDPAAKPVEVLDGGRDEGPQIAIRLLRAWGDARAGALVSVGPFTAAMLLRKKIGTAEGEPVESAVAPPAPERAVRQKAPRH